jgi:5-methylcytosine-specific restriction protein A
MRDRFYDSPEWVRLRAAVRQARPICEVAGCGLPTSHVDHIRPITEGGARLDPANLQVLCTSDHNSKTARQKRPSYQRSDKPLRATGCNPDGTPRDPLHPWRR